MTEILLIIYRRSAMKKFIRILVFIVLFAFVFCKVTSVNLAKSIDKTENQHNTESKKEQSMIEGSEQERVTELQENQTIIESLIETKCIIESETEGIPTETTTEKEIEETLIETEIENTTESEIEEILTEIEPESVTESETEETLIETEVESATESEIEEISTEIESESVTENEIEDGSLLINKVVLCGDGNWNDNKNCYYTKQDHVEIKVSIINEINTEKEIAIQIGDNVLSQFNDEKDTYVGNIVLSEGENEIVISLMLEGKEEDRRKLNIIQDCVPPIIIKVDGKEIKDNKFYQNEVIKIGEIIMLEVNEEEASGIKEVKILDCDKKEINYRTNIDENKVTCTFMEPLANTILEAFVIDNAGNESDKFKIFLDTELPETHIIYSVVENTQIRELYNEMIENNICKVYTNKEQFSAELKVQDKVSGIAIVEAEIDGVSIKPIVLADEEQEKVSYQFDFKMHKSKQTITYRITDLAGNCSEIAYEILLDKTAPRCQQKENGIQTLQNKTFQIPIYEDESGIWKAYIEREGKRYVLTANDVGYGYTFSEEEIDKSTEKVAYTLYLMDKAGNIFTDCFYLLFDFTPPQIELAVHREQEGNENPFSCELSGTIERYYTNTNCKLVVTVTDKTNGGCSSGEMMLTLLTEKNGTRHKENLKLVNGVCETVVTFSGKEYENNIYTLQACDIVGNRSEYTFEIIYDSVTPVITIMELDEGIDKQYQKKRQLSLSIDESYFSENNFILLPLNTQKEEDVPKISSWTTKGTKHSASLIFSNDGIYCFQIVCTDKAGNKSLYKVDKLIIDTIAPKVAISYEKEQQEQGIRYNQPTIITVTDRNFDIAQNHKLLVVSDNKKPIISKWKKTENADQYSCTVQFAEDGVYQFQCAYKDKAGNVSDMVVSDILVIDNTLPLIQASYADKKNKMGIYCNTSGVLHIDITEENFSKEFVEVILHNQKSAKKINLKVPWNKTAGHLYKATYQIQEDGMYNFTVICKDKAGNKAEVYQSDIFLVDRNKPIVNISYEETKQMDDCYKGSRTAKITVRDISFDENCTTNFNITPNNIPVTISTWTKKNIEHTNEYEYTCTVIFEQDGAYTFEFSCVDQAGNFSEIVKGGSFIIDNTAPVIQMDFEHTDTNDGKIYHKTKTAIVKIIEQNFVKENVRIEPIGLTTANTFFVENMVPTADKWLSDGIVHSTTINFSEDGIYGFRIICKDKAGNEGKMELDNGKFCIIDTTAPSVKITYDKDTLKDKFYYGTRIAKVTVTDANFDEHCEINFDFGTENAKPRIGKWRQEGTDSICEISFQKDGEYHFQFSCKDKAGNLSKTIDGGSFAIDTTKPEISVTFDNNNVKNENYYNASRTATITIIEKAFSEQLVQIEALDTLEVDKLPSVSKWKTNGECHTATINFTKEGVYGFQIACKDLAGNTAKDYVSTFFVIDKTAPQITFDGVRANSANNGVVMPVVNYRDSYLDETATIVTLTGTNHSDQTTRVQKNVTADGIQLVYPDFAHVKEMDDVYTLRVKAVDLAGNEKEEELNFSVNRFGSTYKVSADTQKLIEDCYTTKAPVITVMEVNIDALEYGEVTISREGKTKTLVREKDYIVNKKGTEVEWKSYTYKIKADNFSSDGVYSVGFYSVDKAKNASNSRMKGKEIEFVLDTTAPSIVVDGIESGKTYKEQEKKVTLDVKDNLYLSDLQVTDNGETILCMSERELTEKNGIITFFLQEKETEREIVITARDKAKNEQIQRFYGVLISSKKEVLQQSVKKKTQNKKGMTERNMVTEDITEYSNNLTEPIYQKEDYLLYGVSAVTFIVVFVTAGIVQIRKKRQKKL